MVLKIIWDWDWMLHDVRKLEPSVFTVLAYVSCISKADSLIWIAYLSRSEHIPLTPGCLHFPPPKARMSEELIKSGARRSSRLLSYKLLCSLCFCSVNWNPYPKFVCIEMFSASSFLLLVLYTRTLLVIFLNKTNFMPSTYKVKNLLHEAYRQVTISMHLFSTRAEKA